MRRILVIVVLFFGLSAYSQRDMYLSFEALGSGGFGSLNYEVSLFDSEITDLYFRSGLSFAPIDKNNGTGIVFPLMVHGTFGPGSHKLDLGLGQAFTITTKLSMFLRMPFAVGYRLQPVDKRYYFRVSYTPIISYIYNFQLEHWGGLTFGYQIK